MGTHDRQPGQYGLVLRRRCAPLRWGIGGAMNRTGIVAVALLWLAGCSSGGGNEAALTAPASPEVSQSTPTPTPTPTPTLAPTSGPLTLRLEWWTAFESLGDGKCRLTEESGWRERISTGRTITLIGPNDDELAAQPLASGRLQKSTETDRDYYVNLPKKKICVFEAEYDDVPVVATYRLKFQDASLNELSTPRDLIDSNDGVLEVLFGAEIRD